MTSDGLNSELVSLRVLKDTLQQIDIIRLMLEEYTTTFGLATSAEEVMEIHRSGRVASLIGIEGLHQIADSASVLRNFYRLGVRYATLTHTQNNRYADSAVRVTVQNCTP